MDKKEQNPAILQRLNTARMAGAFARKMYEAARHAGEEGAPVAWCMVNWRP